MTRYAVIDLETTGLSPAHHHRVLEVAVVLVDDDGQLVYEWDTLVNPSRDVGATEIHGLSAADLHRAPTFDRIAGELGSLLCGRVPVAHNLAFDAAFLSAEFDRLGHSVPLSKTNGICTMRLAGLYLSSGGRSLGSCCEVIGCPLESAHSALEDARGTARLLSHFMKTDGDFLRRWIEVVVAAQNSLWPALPASGATRVSRQHAAAARGEHFLGRLVSVAPRFEVHPEANSYLALLDRALLDRQLSLHEEDELVSIATMLGLSREDAFRLHRLYLAALGRLATEDGVVTPAERVDLDLVAVMLGLTTDDVEAALEREVDPIRTCGIGTFLLHQGDAVVFTGEAPNTERADLEYQARTLGLRPTSSVSKKTRLLVSADPDSLSGKARKARDLGLPIVDYATYFTMLEGVAT